MGMDSQNIILKYIAFHLSERSGLSRNDIYLIENITHT